MRRNRLCRALLLLLPFLLIPVLPALAQQTGEISGTVTDPDGLALPGVSVTATSNVLPTPRVTVSGGVGDFRLQALPPGTYTLSFELSGMTTVTRQAEVGLATDTRVDVKLGLASLEESVTVTATATLVEREAATIKSSVGSEQIEQLPVGQEYRDLIKLIPGVQYTQDQVRGPSAGGSGQDNVYKFDGVNVTLPLFGTQGGEPSTHDIDQVTTVKGGARAVDFDRAGGFSIDTVSKSGTNSLRGMFGYQFQDNSMAADLDSGSLSRYEQDRTWLTANIGGPLWPNRLFFYGSYYRPERSRENRANAYGELPDYESVRNEGFGKLTYTPIANALVNFSYRQSAADDTSSLFGQTSSATTGTGSESDLRILTLDGSWVIGARGLATFKYTRFRNDNLGRPDFISDTEPNLTIGTRLDPARLDQVGRFTVPVPVAGQTSFNAFVQPLIDQYGYINDAGVKTGGGTVGLGAEFNNQDFRRDAGQVALNWRFGSTVSHDLHVGYQYSVESEFLERTSNGWGLISAPGGRLSAPIAGNPQRAYYTARVQRQEGSVRSIESEYRSHNIEVNDQIRWGNWTFNAGALFSNDTLYGQGLREDDSTLSGYVAAPGNRYEMYQVSWGEMFQPRVGVTWAYNGRDTIYGSYARYTPAVSSLPRAASWDRNITGTFIDAHFDQNGILFGSVPVGSSSGKLFVDDMDPRTVDEFLAGTAREFGTRWTSRLYYRYREASNFWEDTNNNARVAFNPPSDIPRELYIPDLAAQLAQIGSGSSYVIAELDGAYTKYHELTVETEWRGTRDFVRASYTWTRYRGNFDQDNSTGNNDAAIFMGSSNIADGAGRQLWDFKDGTLRGDRPFMLKVYGYHLLPWSASAGAYFVAQSGQPWEAWSYEPYIALTTSTSDTNRYAEPAGSRRTDAHYQVDLNYTQNFRFGRRFNVQLAADLYNVFDNQTGYDYQPSVHTATFGTPRLYFDPRRLQIAARVQF
jgi:hypothetical protein